jgi:hypothetical protein
MSSGRRWGDSSDEEDDGNHVSIAHHKVQASANEPHQHKISEEADFSPIADPPYDDYDDNQQTENAQDGIPQEQVTDEEDEQEVEEEEPESDEEDEETRQRRIDTAKEAAAKKKAEQDAKKKTATVEDQLDNLDDILNEFGIETQSSKEADTTNGNAEPKEATADNETKPLSKRKKPKKKKSENGLDDSVSESQEPEETPATVALDPDAAAKVLKAKVAASKGNNGKKPMSTAQSAAAAAAKEMKTSAGDEKKKKKKLKQQAQNFGR